MIEDATQRRGGNVRVAAKDFGISPRFLRTAISQGELESHLCGGKTVILYEDLTAWIKRQGVPRFWRRRADKVTKEEFREHVNA